MDRKSTLERREQLDELTARTRYEVRLYLNNASAGDEYDDVERVFGYAHDECSALVSHHRLLPRWERHLLNRYCKRIYGAAVLRAVGDTPRDPDSATEIARRFCGDVKPPDAFRDDIAGMAPDSGDTGAKYDMQGRGLLNVFRLAVGEAGKAWADSGEVAATSARNVLTCSEKFLRRRLWHVLWPVYRVRGLRLWKL